MRQALPEMVHVNHRDIAVRPRSIAFLLIGAGCIGAGVLLTRCGGGVVPGASLDSPAGVDVNSDVDGAEMMLRRLSEGGRIRVDAAPRTPVVGGIDSDPQSATFESYGGLPDRVIAKEADRIALVIKQREEELLELPTPQGPDEFVAYCRCVQDLEESRSQLSVLRSGLAFYAKGAPPMTAKGYQILVQTTLPILVDAEIERVMHDQPPPVAVHNGGVVDMEKLQAAHQARYQKRDTAIVYPIRLDSFPQYAAARAMLKQAFSVACAVCVDKFNAMDFEARRAAHESHQKALEDGREWARRTDVTEDQRIEAISACNRLLLPKGIVVSPPAYIATVQR